MSTHCPRRSFTAAAAVLALGLSLCAADAPDRRATPGRDWPMFGGTPARNLVNPFAKGLPPDWKVELEATPARPDGLLEPVVRIKSRKNVKWVARLGMRADSGVVVAGGKVYIGTNNSVPRNLRDRDPKRGTPLDLGVLLSLREADGSLLWQAVHDRLPTGIVNDWPKEGLQSMPAVEGNRLYYVSNRSELICADTEGFRDGQNDGVQDEKRNGPTDADVVWRLDMREKLDVFPHDRSVCSPLIVGDLVFVITGNGVDETHVSIPAPAAPSFLAVNKRTGKVVWQDNSPTASMLKMPVGADPVPFFKRLADRGGVVMHGQWSSPAYAVVGGKPQVIFPGGDGWLRSFDPRTGKQLWRFDCNPKDVKFNFRGPHSRSDFLATPVIHDGKVYIGLGQDREHDVGVGHLWCIDMKKEGDVSPELITDANVWPPKTVPNPNSAMVWHYGGPTPAIVARKIGRRRLFGRTLSTCAVHDGLVYAADLDGFLHCLDARTGKVCWVHNLKAATCCSPLWADRKVYLGDEEFVLHIFAHRREKKVLNANEMDGPIRGVPVAANRVLYVATQTHLYALAQD